jgi:hypothetical protein
MVAFLRGHLPARASTFANKLSGTLLAGSHGWWWRMPSAGSQIEPRSRRRRRKRA